MQLEEESPMIGVIVSVYYLGCAIGAILASFYAVSQLPVYVLGSFWNFGMYTGDLDHTI